MSLDIYLYTPDKCPHCGKPLNDGAELFWQNITHNLGKMADEAGLYRLLWHPQESGINSAADLIEPLEKGIAAMKADPPRFERHNAPNGWGLYEHFVPWLERLLVACKEHPTATVRSSI